MKIRPALRLLATLLSVTLLASAAQGESVSDPYSYARTKSFTYDSAGRVVTETVEPDRASHCVVNTYAYAPTGQRTSVTQANCPGAVAPATFSARTTKQSFEAVAGQAIVVAGQPISVNVPAGLVATSETDALQRQKLHTYDPRFGVPLTTRAIDGLVTQYEVDDFGRRIRTTMPDGTYEVVAYCFLAPADTSSNSPTCAAPAAGEAPGDAVSYTQTTPFGSTGGASGSVVRVFMDKSGRAIRTTTRSFDDASQPAGHRDALVATDVVYDTSGNKSLETQPYFLSTGSTELHGSGDVGVTHHTYDALGRPLETFTSDPAGSASHTFGGSAGPVAYGNYGTRLSARFTRTYDGLVRSEANAFSQQTSTTLDALGQPLRIADPSGAQLSQLRDAFGNLVRTRDALGNEVAAAYDYLGRRTQLHDPDKGLWTYAYDALGQLVAQQSPRQRAQTPPLQTTLEYDAVGRLVRRADDDAVRTWTYDCAGQAGRLCQTSMTNGVSKMYRYDALGRVTGTRVDISAAALPASESFGSALSYDQQTGRVASQTFPTGLSVGYDYTPLGRLKGLRLQTGATVTPLPHSQGGTAAGGSYPAGTILWQALSANAKGAAVASQFANGVGAATSFEPGTGRITALAAGTGSQRNVLDQSFNWDAVGNLISRGDGLDGGGGAVSETFKYGEAGSGPGDINRLTRYTVAGPNIPGLFRSVHLSYNALGSLLFKSDVGNYAYPAAGSARPHALQSVGGSPGAQYDGNGNLIAAAWGKYAGAAYTAGDYIKTAAGTGASAPTYTWWYDENDTRLLEVRDIAAGPRAGRRKLWYLPADNAGGLSFEREVNEPVAASETNPQVASNRHFLRVGGENVGVLVSTGSLPVLEPSQHAPPVLSGIGLNKVEFWHKDHLGSVAATTDHAGTVTARYAYDPFGQRRFTSGAADAAQSLEVDWSAGRADGTARGFTGHEHLDDIGLVNMNGRVYDAVLGTFIQADTHVQFPENLQSYNRYAYLLNNPLNATDPTGFDRWGSGGWDSPGMSYDAFSGLSPSWHLNIINGTLFLVSGELASRWQAAVDTFASVGPDRVGGEGAAAGPGSAREGRDDGRYQGARQAVSIEREYLKLLSKTPGSSAEWAERGAAIQSLSERYSALVHSGAVNEDAALVGSFGFQLSIVDYKLNGDGEKLVQRAAAFGVLAAMHTGTGSAARGTRWKLGPNDLDFRGSGKGVRDAIDTAFERIGLPRSEFVVTRWGRDANGKSFPAEWRHKSGAEVNVDWAHAKNGPDAPHVGFQTGGKRGEGGAIRGHILLDDVPFNR